MKKAARQASPGKAVATTAPPAPTDAQLQQVMDWIIQGAAEHEIRDGIYRTFPGACSLTLITAVLNHFNQVATIDQPGLVSTFGWCLEASKEMYRRMVEQGDYVGALRAIKQIKDLANEAATLYTTPDPPPD